MTRSRRASPARASAGAAVARARRAGLASEAEPVTAAAARLSRSPAQVVLRWHIQLGAAPIPKSSSPDRQAANLEIFDFTLTDDEMTTISGLARGRFGGDPVTHEEF